MNIKEDNSKLFNNYRQAQEYEKKRIANELHDTSLQTLAYLINEIDLISLYVDKDADVAKLELLKTKDVLQSVIDEMRNTIFNLRPMSFDDLSLREAIEQYILSMDSKSSINYNYEIDDVEFSDEFYKLEFFRCIQECINNSEKHSKAKNIDICIKNEDSIIIEIKDDGIGFDVESVMNNNNSHFGLRIIQDRVELMDGILFIDSSINNGVFIKINIPFSK